MLDDADIPNYVKYKVVRADKILKLSETVPPDISEFEDIPADLPVVDTGPTTRDLDADAKLPLKITDPSVLKLVRNVSLSPEESKIQRLNKKGADAAVRAITNTILALPPEVLEEMPPDLMHVMGSLNRNNIRWIVPNMPTPDLNTFKTITAKVEALPREVVDTLVLSTILKGYEGAGINTEKLDNISKFVK